MWPKAGSLLHEKQPRCPHGTDSQNGIASGRSGTGCADVAVEVRDPLGGD